MNIKKTFGVFLCINAILWSIIPLLRTSLPMDTQEAIIWGKFCLWGTTKHPPFSGWIAYYFYLLLGKTHFSMYLLSQIFVALGVIYIYKLARCFVDETKAVLASMLQFGIIYYNFSSVEFNVNVVSLALWPISAFYFWEALQNNRWKNWILFGIFCGFNLLNKYVSGTLIVALGIFILADKNARRVLKNYRFYVAVLCGILLVLPHIIWLYDNNFIMLKYILFRAGTEGENQPNFLSHFIYPLKFAGAQILFALATLITYFSFYKKSQKDNKNDDITKRNFLLILGFVPAGIFVLISFVGGIALKSMWGFPCWFLAGISLMYFFPMQSSAQKAKKIFVVMVVWSCLFLFAYVGQCLLNKSERFHLDNQQFVRQMTEIWKKDTGGQKLEYIASDAWYGNMFALQNDDVKPMIWLDVEKNPWFDADDFQEKGAFVVVSNLYEYAKYNLRAQNQLSEPKKVLIEIHNHFGKTKIKEVFYGYYKVKGLLNEQ